MKPDGLLKQGRHPDPLDPTVPRPHPATWPPRQRKAFASASMRHYRAALQLAETSSVRDSVLDDLSSYFHLDPQECVGRCLDWEQWSLREWQRRERNSAEGLADFYRTTLSWSFDLLWYAYLQAEGYRYPISVAIAESVLAPKQGQRHLDFGSGVGVTSQLFQRLGFETDLADVSTSLLGFARFRLERRSVRAGYIDLNVATPEPMRYDVVTAISTLNLVPDLAVTAGMLHRTLRPGGVIFANFDVRPKTPENAWHLYDDDLPLRWQLQRTGFEPEESLDGMITRYRKVEPAGLRHQARGFRDAILLRSPLRPVYRSTRAAVRRALQGVNGR